LADINTNYEILNHVIISTSVGANIANMDDICQYWY